ncbi:MAG: hypothetical protein PT944_04100 [Actinomycetaceae bacterium]|nr:hypothetical protein [Arcanobacterium sp.]MDD7687086.1 hypothetical protein [Actinomycetaceae bacterium]MDY5273248.1 hypothetical protein [Arcanobacterium sp.]
MGSAGVLHNGVEHTHIDHRNQAPNQTTNSWETHMAGADAAQRNRELMASAEAFVQVWEKAQAWNK